MLEIDLVFFFAKILQMWITLKLKVKFIFKYPTHIPDFRGMKGRGVVVKITMLFAVVWRWCTVRTSYESRNTTYCTSGKIGNSTFLNNGWCHLCLERGPFQFRCTPIPCVLGLWKLCAGILILRVMSMKKTTGLQLQIFLFLFLTLLLFSYIDVKNWLTKFP